MSREYIDSGGIVYSGKPIISRSTSCDGCAFMCDENACDESPICFDLLNDNNNIIWVVKE